MTTYDIKKDEVLVSTSEPDVIEVVQVTQKLDVIECNKVDIDESNSRIVDVYSTGMFIVGARSSRIDKILEEIKDRLGLEHLTPELRALILQMDNLLGTFGSDIQGLKDQVLIEITTRHNQFESLSQMITTLEANFSDQINSQFQENILVVSNDLEALAQQIISLTAQLNDETTNRNAAIDIERTARVNSNSALAQQITTLTANISDESSTRSAQVQNLETALVTANEAMASNVLNLNANFSTLENNVSSQILDQQVVMSTATDAFAQDLQTLTATVNTTDTEVRSLITNESVVRSNEFGAMAQNISILSTNFSNDITNTNALITQEATARSDADSALATQINTVNSSVGDLTTTVNTYSSSINGIEGKWGVTINANGQLTGLEILGGGSTQSAIKLRADRFELRDTAGNLMIGSGINYGFVSGGPPANANFVNNTNQLSDGAGLGNTATWSSVSGTGKPANNATVNNGAFANLNGSLTAANHGTYISNLAVGRLKIGDLGSVSLSVYFSNGYSGSVAYNHWSGRAVLPYFSMEAYSNYPISGLDVTYMDTNTLRFVCHQFTSGGVGFTGTRTVTLGWL